MLFCMVYQKVKCTFTIFIYSCLCLSFQYSKVLLANILAKAYRKNSIIIISLDICKCNVLTTKNDTGKEKIKLSHQEEISFKVTFLVKIVQKCKYINIIGSTRLNLQSFFYIQVFTLKYYYFAQISESSKH